MLSESNLEQSNYDLEKSTTRMDLVWGGSHGGRGGRPHHRGPGPCPCPWLHPNRRNKKKPVNTQQEWGSREQVPCAPGRGGRARPMNSSVKNLTVDPHTHTYSSTMNQNPMSICTTHQSEASGFKKPPGNPASHMQNINKMWTVASPQWNFFLV
jgi:hypothetical protein